MKEYTHLKVDLGKTWCNPYRNWPIQQLLPRDNLNHTVILEIIYSNISTIILIIYQ